MTGAIRRQSGFWNFKILKLKTKFTFIKSVYPLTINLINQRFIVWKSNNTNVNWKNTATVLNCVSAIRQDEEDRPPISIFWASPCFADDSESYNPLWNLERSTGHAPHTIANIYYPELSGYFKESKPSSKSVPIQEPTPLVCQEGPCLRTWKYKTPC